MKIAKRNPFEGKPVIHTPDIFGATVGKDFFYRIPVTGKRPIEITVNNTEIELKNGIIYGKFDECKKFEIEITAQNSCGTETKPLIISIEKDGVLKTPLLGFTSWNAFGTKVKQEDIEKTADLLIESGIADYGYSYLNLDSGWQSVYGGEFDAVMPNDKFPDMKKMCDYVHSKGLKCGTYSTPMLAAWGCPEGFESIPGTTQGERDPRYPRVFNGGIGLIHKESNNVKQWDAWGFDYLKYDWNIVDVENTELMKKELLGAKREYAYCVVTKAQHDDADYLRKNVNSWRCNQDSSPFWENIRERIDTVDIWSDTVCQGHFYDLDMLTLGGYGEGEKKNELTQDEEIFLFTLVSFFMSPIQISTPIDKLDDFLLNLVCNEEIIKINQDILADYPKPLKRNDIVRVYKRNLSNGDLAFALFNISEKEITEIVELDAKSDIFDVWKKEYMGNSNILKCTLAPHSAAVYRVGECSMKIKTVCGEIEKSNLGIVAPHEHVLLDLTAFYQALPVPGIDDPETQKVEMWNLGILNRDCYALKDNLLLNNEELAIKELMFYKNAGGNTMVDASLPGIGRDPEGLKRISEATGLNIIMGTGFYVGSTHPKEFDTMSDEEIADLMVCELEDGINGICAGYIGEIGISEIFDDKERRVLRAAAIAHKKTDAAINVHINPWTTNGIEAADILLQAGVKPEKICISHIDVENREDYILELLKKGVYIEFDNFGKEYYIRREVRNSGYGNFVHDTERVTLVKKLIDMGYLNRILLTCDLCLKNLLHYYGGWGYDHVLTNIVPMMEDEGITNEQIKTMLVNNPANWLC